MNSYNEYSPWTRAMVTPITYYIANNDEVHAELINLNSSMITDTTTYNKVKDQFLSSYSGRKVDYVAFIGQVAFTFRDEIKRLWGDIPMLLITRDLTIADNEYYFSGYDKELAEDTFKSLTDLKRDYNFTAIYIPDYYKETINMMHGLIPQMNELVFFADAAYFNRYLAQDIEVFLMEEYPDIKFKWVQASPQADLDLQYYLVHREPKTGLLMSSWFYEKIGALGYPSLVMGDLNLLFSSTNPVFSLRHAYMGLGAIGGVYSNPETVKATITDFVSRIVNGEPARNIKFYSNRDNTVTVINYPLLKEYELNIDNCPDDTIYVDRPLSFWKKYTWQIIAAITFAVLLVFLFLRRNMAQRHEIEILSRHKKFVENMPVPYAKARVQYNNKLEVVNIKYSVFNQAFDEILQENKDKSKPFTLFPAKVIAEKATEMLESDRPVSFMHYLEKTDKFYIFTLCIVGFRKAKGERKSKSKEVVDYIDIFAIDVTERHKNEKRLRETSQRLDMTINLANIIPWEWDMKEDIMYFGSTDIFHRYQRPNSDPSKDNWAEIPTSEFMSMVVPEDKEEVRHLREQLFLQKTSQFHMEYRIKVVKNGQESIEWLDITGAVSERNEKGVPEKVLGSLMLVTDRKKQENDLIEAKEKASEADKMKTAFLANMSHEIRTPLNAIIGFSMLMCETDDAAKRKEFAKVIAKNNDVLLNLVNDVLDLAKIESNTIELNMSVCDINVLINTVAETIRERIQRGVMLNIVNGSPECVVMTDSNRVSQVLMNLLSNACKFTMKGSITIGYDILDNNELHFYVKDTGIGISKENQERLFTRFDKLNNFVQGNGLGLSISKSLVERLGGKIGVESRGEGRGTTFWFSLPYEPVDPEALKEGIPAEGYERFIDMSDTVDNEGDDTDVIEEATPHKKREGDEKPLILAAEDIEGNFLLLKNFVPKDVELIHAWNGQEAVDMHRDRQPDLILMDINMPGMDGYQATAEIRKTDTNVPIVAVTAYAYASDRKRILASGFNDFVSKPVTRNELRQTIERYI